MNDLISRQAAIDMIRLYREDEAVDLDELESSIALMPSAQPEVIRCKDCLMHGVCRFEQGLGLDGYCSQAERRTDETD